MLVFVHVKTGHCAIVTLEHAIVQQDGRETVVIVHVSQEHTGQDACPALVRMELHVIVCPDNVSAHLDIVGVRKETFTIKFCDNGASCSRFNGICNCTAGWRGKSCSRPCSPGTYGIGCIPCECHNGATCNRMSGQCVCSPGYRGKS